METNERLILTERNPKTQATHRREVFWQITLPLSVGVLLLLGVVGMVILSATQPVTNVERWADVSLIWVILPALFFAFIVLVILIGIVYAFTMLLQIIPHYAQIIQHYFEVGKDKVSQLSDLISEPVIRIRSFWAAARHAGRFGK